MEQKETPAEKRSQKLRRSLGGMTMVAIHIVDDVDILELLKEEIDEMIKRIKEEKSS